MYNELSKKDIQKIIHSLIKFIVIDSKVYVAKEKQQKYTLHYLNTLVQIINNESPISKNEYALIEGILKDIEKNI